MPLPLAYFFIFAIVLGPAAFLRMSSCGWPQDYMFYAWCVNVMQSVPGCGTVWRWI